MDFEAQSHLESSKDVNFGSKFWFWAKFPWWVSCVSLPLLLLLLCFLLPLQLLLLFLCLSLSFLYLNPIKKNISNINHLFLYVKLVNFLGQILFYFLCNFLFLFCIFSWSIFVLCSTLNFLLDFESKLHESLKKTRNACKIQEKLVQIII